MPPVNPKRIRKPVGSIRPVGSKSRKTSQGAAPAILAFVGVLGLGGGAWWYLQNQPATTTPEAVVETKSAEKAPVMEAVQAAPAVAAVEVAPKMDAPPAPAKEEEAPAPPPETKAEPVSFEKLLVLDEMGAAKKENLAWNKESLKGAIESGQWEDYRDLLGRSLKAFGGGRADTATVIASPTANTALQRHAFISTITEPVLLSVMKEGLAADHVRWLMNNPDAMQAFTVQVNPKDNIPKALEIWALLAEQDNDATGAYMELAIACSLVFDREIRTTTGKAINPSERYSYFKNNSEKGKLAAKIKKMHASELVWVVGVPVDQEELEWALKEADFKQKSWGQAYGMIKYDMEKAVTGKNPYDKYTFAEIKKKGGVCSDRSYFSAWTACAHGVPAAIVSGDGSRGPHAWITWMSDEGNWDFSGRFDGYPAGHCRSPQTGKDISEEEFVRLSDKKASDTNRYVRAHQNMWMADVFASEPAKSLAFLTESIKAAPKLAEPSAALLTYWMKNRGAATLDEWKAFLRDLRKDFRDSDALMKLAAQAETEFVFARQDIAETMKNLKRETRKIGDSAGEDAGMEVDLGRLTASYRNQAELLKKAGDMDSIRTLYRRALSDHGDDAASFKALTKDFFSFIKEDTELASKACRDLESACRRYVGRGKGDWFDVTSQNSAWRTVAECYRIAGDTKKADSIVKDCDSRERVAKKKAI